MDAFQEDFTANFETATLKGSRVTLVGLRELSDEDAPSEHALSATGLFQKICESRAFLEEHLPWVADTSPADLKKRARSWVLAERLGQGGCWQILEAASLRLAGFIMMDVNLRNRSATVSYWLFPDFTGQGLMTQSLELLDKFCFEVLHLNRLEIFASAVNTKSQAVAARCGYVKEGVCRDFELKNGIFVDHVRFSRLARD